MFDYRVEYVTDNCVVSVVIPDVPIEQEHQLDVWAGQMIEDDGIELPSGGYWRSDRVWAGRKIEEVK